MRLISVLAALLGAALACSAARAQTAPEPVEVLVLGTFHFANPGRDLHNPQVDDVRSPKRQAELAAAAEQLARFKPTIVAVEEESRAADLSLASYKAFKPADLTRNRDETQQIGFRRARAMGHANVYGVDEQPGPGEPDYFPFGKVAAYAGAHGKGEWLKALSAPVQAHIAAFQQEQPKRTMGELLRMSNDRAHDAKLHAAGYYGLLSLGDPAEQPGAELNALWYMRNAKIFAKLTQVAKPGDRVVLIFGAGHSYWLRHFVETAPGYRLVDPRDYLR